MTGCIVCSFWSCVVTPGTSWPGQKFIPCKRKTATHWRYCIFLIRCKSQDWLKLMSLQEKKRDWAMFRAPTQMLLKHTFSSLTTEGPYLEHALKWLTFCVLETISISFHKFYMKVRLFVQRQLIQHLWSVPKVKKVFIFILYATNMWNTQKK